MSRYVLILSIHLVGISKPVSGDAYCKVHRKKRVPLNRLGTLLPQYDLENSEG